MGFPRLKFLLTGGGYFHRAKVQFSCCFPTFPESGCVVTPPERPNETPARMALMKPLDLSLDKNVGFRIFHITMQNFSFQGSTRTFFTSNRFRPASGASGSATQQKFWVFGLTDFYFIVSRAHLYRYAKFYASTLSGSALDHNSPESGTRNYTPGHKF